MAAMSKPVRDFVNRNPSEQTPLPPSDEQELVQSSPIVSETPTVEAAHPCASCEAPTCFLATEITNSPGPLKRDFEFDIAQLIEELPIKINLNNLSPSSTPQTSQSESLIIKYNHKQTLRIGQRLIRRYKRLLRDTSTLSEGKVQVRSKAFRFVRKSRRGRTDETKALIRLFFASMDREVKSKGWIKVLLEGIMNLAAKFGMKEEFMKGKSLWPRKKVNKIMTDIEKMEQSPSSKEEEEANQNLFNKELGTWGSW